MLDELDALIEEATVWGELSTGTKATWLVAHADPRMVSVMASSTKSEHANATEWTQEEEQFVIENMRWMTDAEIGKKLGRTADAVKIHRFRHLRYDARRKDAEWPTLQQVMRIMGVKCQKTVAMWVNQGLIPARTLPTAMGEIRAIARQTLIRWAVNPENWIYFKHERVTDPYLRRLLQLRRARWNDEWWTPGQVGAYHGVTHMAINNCIHDGRLRGKKWGNWWIRRSDAIALKIYPKKGYSTQIEWTDSGDAFVVLATALGYSQAAIGNMSKWPRGRVPFRLQTLQESGVIPRLIQNQAVQFNSEIGNLFADWRDYLDKFPLLASACIGFRRGKARECDLPYIAYTLYTWAQWHAQTEAQRYTAFCIRHGMNTLATLQGHYRELLSWGVDPFGDIR